MNVFQLSDEVCKISNVNPRAEKHGDEPVLMCDVSIQIDLKASILDEFAKGLKDAIFVKSKQGRVDDEDEGPALRFAGVLGVLAIKKEFEGYTASIKWGDLAGSTTVELVAVTVHKFKVDAQQGGTCATVMQLTFHPEKSGVIDQISHLLDREVSLTLLPAGVKKSDVQETADTDPEVVH